MVRKVSFVLLYHFFTSTSCHANYILVLSTQPSPHHDE